MDYLLTLFSLLGLAISSYFTAVAYRWVSPQSRWIPAFCRMGEKTCASIIDSPRAKLLGIPNSVLGQFYYLAVLTAVATGTLREPPFYSFLLAAAAASVAAGLFLTYSLLFLTRVPCRLCFTSHFLNLCILLLLIFG